MPLTTFPDLLSFNQRNRTTTNIKTQLDRASQEAVTGIRSDLTAASNGRVGEVHLLRKALSDIDLSDRINTVTSTRIDLMAQGISGARTAMNGIDSRARVAFHSNSEAGMTSIVSEAETNLRSVFDSLSVKHGTRNLLSGNRTDTPPYAHSDVLLDDIKQIVATAGSPADIETALDTYFDDPAGGFNTRIYLGATDGAGIIRLGDSDEIHVDVRGNNDAIKKVLRGLSVMAASTSSAFPRESSEFSDIFLKSVSAAAEGTSALINLETDIGIFAETIDKIKTRNSQEKLSLSSAYQSIVGRDQFEAATELKKLEVQLESSYIITARLSSLSLVNFLR